MDGHEFLESKGIKSMGDIIPAKVVEEWLKEFAGRKANRFDADVGTDLLAEEILHVSLVIAVKIDRYKFDLKHNKINREDVEYVERNTIVLENALKKIRASK